MRIVVMASPSFEALGRLPRDRGVEFLIAHDPDSFRRLLPGAEVALIAPRYGALIRDAWPDMGGIRWIHALGAGVEHFPFDLLRRRDIVVTNSRGVYAEALAEFVIAAMLWFAKDLRRLLQNQNARRWEPYTVHRLEGATVGIIGYGAVGRAVARRAEAFATRVLTLRRHEGMALDELIPSSDYLVLSAALTPETRGLIDAKRIASMRPTAVLINVSRGTVVDEAALIEALRSRRIRGAALDVFEVEPLPPAHPLWTLDNVLISPHTADHAADSHARAIDLFLGNLERFQKGEPLANVVDKDLGY